MTVIAEPVLASALWDPGSAANSSPGPQLSVNCKAIDRALMSGIAYGCITFISAEPDSGARALTQALLVSHLLSASDTSATVIDTGQAVDVRRVYLALGDRLSAGGDGDAKTKVKAALDRVKLMKTFDFEGLTEAVAEVRDRLEGRGLVEHAPKVPRSTVPDSQADDEDEMLDEPADSVLLLRSNADRGRAAPPDIIKHSSKNFLIIDSLTLLTAPLLKSNHAYGQALLTAFLRSLNHLTKTHNLCTVVVNSTIPTNTKIQAYSNKEDSPSAFASCTARPALGKTLGHLMDLHLLLHLMPRAGDDAKAIYRGPSAESDGLGRGEMVSVMEVIQDRSDGRVGRWAAFTTDEGEKMRDVR